MKIPLAIALFATTKGHWGINTRWRETVNDLNSQIPLGNFSALFSNIKVTNNEEISFGNEIAEELKSLYGFNNHLEVQDWKHFDVSHQVGYLSDIFRMYNNPKVLESQYVLHLEDDWLIRAEDGDLLKWINKAINLLEKNPNILQVRFPRFNDEFKRINNLKERHGIDTYSRHHDDDFFVHSDFSLNPSIFRTRDLRNATLLIIKNQNSFGPHVEHDFGRAVKYFSNPQESLSCFYPNKARSYHIGSLLNEEDKIGLELNALDN
jgi:hypothetical protein